MSRQSLDFPTRLALARKLVAHGPSPLPTHVRDQLGAASDETRVLHDRIGAALPLLDPDRNWRERIDMRPSDEVRAHLLAATIGCLPCVHLRKDSSPQPAFVQLPLRRSDCARCSQTLRKPPAEDDDRCDVCGAPEVLTFYPFAVRLGPAIIAGNACVGCAGALGIRQEATA